MQTCRIDIDQKDTIGYTFRTFTQHVSEKDLDKALHSIAWGFNLEKTAVYVNHKEIHLVRQSGQSTWEYIKYALGQDVWYMLGNIIHSAPVLARMCVDNAHDDWTHTDAQKSLFTPYGRAGVFYATCHHTMLPECKVFASKEALLNTL